MQHQEIRPRRQLQVRGHPLPHLSRAAASTEPLQPAFSVGNLCKIVNSVLMDGVTVGDSCDIRNSVICSGCTIQEGATIKDCHVSRCGRFALPPCLATPLRSKQAC